MVSPESTAATHESQDLKRFKQKKKIVHNSINTISGTENPFIATSNTVMHHNSTHLSLIEKNRRRRRRKAYHKNENHKPSMA